MNCVFLQHRYPPAIIPPILRNEYISAIQKTNKDDDAAFYYFIARSVYDELLSITRHLKGVSQEEYKKQKTFTPML